MIKKMYLTDYSKELKCTNLSSMLKYNELFAAHKAVNNRKVGLMDFEAIKLN